MKALSPSEEISILKTNLNSQFKILSSFWIIFMQGGFAFLEAGSVRSKNTTSILFKNVLDMFVGALVYWGFGYSFAYGSPGNGFIGHNYFFSSNLNPKESDILQNITQELPGLFANTLQANEYFTSFVLSFGYATAASTIISGGLAERVRMPAYLIYSALVTGFVYPVVAHWVWDENGWLHCSNGLTFTDHAGSAVVHVTGGMCALVGASIVGPRIGRFPEDEDASKPIRGHSLSLACIGAFMLFVGFLAFNASSQDDISGVFGSIVPLTVMNTVLSASSGALSALITNSVIQYARKRKAFWSLITILDGYLGGLVAVCAGSNQMKTWASVLTGCLAGTAVILWKNLLVKWKIDDPVDAIPVHLGGGLTGVLTAPIWVFTGQKENGQYVGGIVYAGTSLAFKGYGWNVLGTVCILAWTGSISLVLFASMKKMNILRVSRKHEISGLDLVYHGEPAYPKSERLPIRKMINYDF